MLLPKKKNVVVLIPTHQANPSKYEIISFAQCVKVLGHYDVRIICPRSLDTQKYLSLCNTISIDRYDDRWFSSIQMYNQLKKSLNFYLKYRNYDYMLTYELDSFVFRDELSYWCDQGYSYIGAPWFEGYCNPTKAAKLIAVGNSGFSLRRIGDCIHALLRFAYVESPKLVYRRLFEKDRSAGFMGTCKNYLKAYVLSNSTFFLFNRNSLSEDRFWCDCVAKKHRWFTIPSCEEALRFSAEVNPGALYKLNANQLPFGCHAWARHDLEFWKPHIENQGHSL